MIIPDFSLIEQYLGVINDRSDRVILFVTRNVAVFIRVTVRDILDFSVYCKIFSKTVFGELRVI